MTKEEQLYYNNFFDLFGTPGWSQFIEELEDRAEAYDIGYLNNEKDLFKTQGELSIIRMILNFEQFIEQGYELSTNAQLTSWARETKHFHNTIIVRRYNTWQ